MMKHKKSSVRLILGNLLRAVVVLSLATFLSLALRSMHVQEENILMIYLIAVIIIALEGKGYLWGAVSSIFCVLIFNFLFTEPYFTFRVNNPNYIFTMLLFIVVALITGMLVSRLQEQIYIAKQNSAQTQSLFELTSGYLTITGLENVTYYGIKSLYQILGASSVVYLAKDFVTLTKPYYVKSHFQDFSVMEDDTLAKWCFLNVTPCGYGTSFYSGSSWKYLPIRSGNKALGVMGFYCVDGDIEAEQMVFVDTILSQMATAIEREHIYQEQKKNDA